MSWCAGFGPTFYDAYFKVLTHSIFSFHVWVHIGQKQSAAHLEPCNGSRVIMTSPPCGLYPASNCIIKKPVFLGLSATGNAKATRV
jgi:hypothetical protein